MFVFFYLSVFPGSFLQGLDSKFIFQLSAQAFSLQKLKLSQCVTRIKTCLQFCGSAADFNQIYDVRAGDCIHTSF